MASEGSPFSLYFLTKDPSFVGFYFEYSWRESDTRGLGFDVIILETLINYRVQKKNEYTNPENLLISLETLFN